MNDRGESMFPHAILSGSASHELARIASSRNWGWSLACVGWLHLVAFSVCYYFTVVSNYHDAPGYLAVWIGEMCGIWLIFRICGGARSPEVAPVPLELFIRRVWIAYFLLTFNLGSMNTLRGNIMFEFFPAVASLASFGFIIMGLMVNRKFFLAVAVMFASGLLMAANLTHAYLIFAIAWWLVLNGTGFCLLLGGRPARTDAVPVRKPRLFAGPSGEFSP